VLISNPISGRIYIHFWWNSSLRQNKSQKGRKHNHRSSEFVAPKILLEILAQHWIAQDCAGSSFEHWCNSILCLQNLWKERKRVDWTSVELRHCSFFSLEFVTPNCARCTVRDKVRRYEGRRPDDRHIVQMRRHDYLPYENANVREGTCCVYLCWRGGGTFQCGERQRDYNHERWYWRGRFEREITAKKPRNRVLATDGLWVVCMSIPPEAVYIPSGHLVACLDCIPKMNRSLCLVCRAKIEQIVKVYTVWFSCNSSLHVTKSSFATSDSDCYCEFFQAKITGEYMISVHSGKSSNQTMRLQKKMCVSKFVQNFVLAFETHATWKFPCVEL